MSDELRAWIPSGTVSVDEDDDPHAELFEPSGYLRKGRWVTLREVDPSYLDTTAYVVGILTLYEIVNEHEERE